MGRWWLEKSTLFSLPNKAAQPGTLPSNAILLMNTFPESEAPALWPCHRTDKEIIFSAQEKEKKTTHRRKSSENVFCSYAMAHYGIFLLIACETHLKRWYNVTVALEWYGLFLGKTVSYSASLSGCQHCIKYLSNCNISDPLVYESPALFSK